MAIKGVDRNHVYLTQAGAAAATGAHQVTLSQCHGKQALRIGMLDSAINASHPVFADISVTESVFLEAGYPVSQAHGTAVAISTSSIAVCTSTTCHSNLQLVGVLVRVLIIFFQGVVVSVL